MPISGSQKALMYARSGIMRSGASRSGYYQSYLIVRINNVDRTNQVWKKSLGIDYILGQQPDTGRMRVFGFDPSPGQRVIIADGAIDNRVYGGTLATARQPSTRAAAKKIWDLTLTDWTWTLNKRRVIKQYAAGTLANLAFADLVSSYSTGFSLGKVKSGAPALTGALSFRGTRLAEALTQVADAVGWKWYPDPDQTLHFYGTETEQAPATLQPGTYSYDGLDYTLDISQIRTRVYGVGGGGQTTAPVVAGATTVPVNECGWYTTLPGKFVSGSNVVTFTGVSTSSGAGSLTGCSGIAYDIKAGDTCNVFVQLDDAIAQAALAILEGTGDGIVEDWVENGNWSLATATQQAQAALTAFKNQEVRGTYFSYDRQTAVGKQVPISIAARGINTTVTLQKVTRKLAQPLGRVGGIAGGWFFEASFAIVWSDLVDLVTGAIGIGGTRGLATRR